MAYFMRNNPGDFVSAVGFLQKPVEQVDLAARQRERIGYRRGQHGCLQWHIEATGLSQRFDKLGKSRGPRWSGADFAAKYLSHLIIDHVAETPLKRQRNDGHQS